jgi:hypothetical protein
MDDHPAMFPHRTFDHGTRGDEYLPTQKPQNDPVLWLNIPPWG